MDEATKNQRNAPSCYIDYFKTASIYCSFLSLVNIFYECSNEKNILNLRFNAFHG